MMMERALNLNSERKIFYKQTFVFLFSNEIEKWMQIQEANYYRSALRRRTYNLLFPIVIFF